MRVRKDLELYRLDEGRKKYVYTGGYLAPDTAPLRLLHFKALMVLAALVCALLVFVMGRMNLPSFRTLYVVLPFLGLLFSVGRCLWAAGSLFSWKDRMTANQYRVSWKNFELYAVIAAVLSLALFLSVLAFLFWGGGVFSTESPLFVLCVLLGGISLSIYQALQHNLPDRGSLPG